MDYGDTLKRAWDVTWKNKGLWILGILAGCGANGSNPQQSFTWQTSRGEYPALDRYFQNLPPETMWLIVAGLIFVTLLVVAVVIVLGTLGQTGLIAGVDHADQTGAVTLSQAWGLGLPHFWRMLGMTLLVGVAALLIAVVLGVVFVLGTVMTLGVGLLCLIPLICLAIPLGILFGIYLKLVQNSIVVEKQGIFDSFGRAWRLGRANLGPVVVMGIILILAGVVGGVLLVLPLVAVAFPALVALSSGERLSGALWGLVLCAVVYLPILVVGSGVLQTYINSAWTLTYRRLAGLGSMALAVPSAS